MTTNTKTVAFVNLKGGVGKTTSAIGTAEALARLGHTVTVRDADPSGAATLWAHKALSAGRPLPFGVEVVNRFTVAAPAEEEWVLIDTPPLQTDLVEAAVDAADLVLLVTTTGPIDLERMLETIRQINKPSSVLLTQTRYGTRAASGTPRVPGRERTGPLQGDHPVQGGHAPRAGRGPVPVRLGLRAYRQGTQRRIQRLTPAEPETRKPVSTQTRGHGDTERNNIMEINKPMAARNMLASTLTDYRKPVKLPKITVELDPMLKKRFKAEAVRRGTTIRDMLTAWIERDCPPLDAADARAEAKQDGRRSG